MEYLDIYDENRNFLGKETREKVHLEGLWHNTVHCWLYDKWGNIYFQIRADEKTFYTTASGHVATKETIKEGFGREIKEEIGVNVDFNKAILVDIVVWKMDKVKKDGTIFKDRAFANVYICEYEENIDDFNFDFNEVEGLVKVSAEEALELFSIGEGSIKAKIITTQNNKNIFYYQDVNVNDFLVNSHETALTKYGDVLRKVIENTKVYNNI